MTLQPGQQIKPPFEQDQVPALIERLYGGAVIKTKEMVAYDDRNFFIQVDQDLQGHGKQFTLKITNTLDSNVPQLIEALNETMLCAYRNGLSVPVPIFMQCPGTGQQQVHVIREQLDPLSSDKYAIRLLKFVPGRMLIDMAPYSKAMLTKVGLAAAKLDRVLETIDSQVLRERELTWSMLFIPRLTGFTPAIDDEKRRDLINGIVGEFTSKIMDNLSLFKKVLIHGDINEQNTLVAEDDQGEMDVSGFIDFGDSHFAPQIFELGIVCCYTMLESSDPLEAPKHVIAGYNQIKTFSELEMAVLPLCVRSRLAQSLAMGAYSFKQDPTNTYVLNSAKKGWTVLESMSQFSDKQLLEMWT